MSSKTNVQETMISGSVFDAPSTVQKNQLGQKCTVGAREYVYCSTAGDLTVACAVQQAPASAVTANTLVAASAGATVLQLVLSGVTANQYADGFIFLTDDTGQGYSYAIKSNTAAATVSSVANTVFVTLYDPLIAAVATSTDFVLLPCPYSKVVIGNSSAPGKVLGVAVRATTAATDGTVQYFWAQCKGPGVVLLADATSNVLGKQLMLDGTAGGVKLATAGFEAFATNLSATEDAGGFQPVWLNC